MKMNGSEKKVNENTYDISSKKRVTKILFTWRWGPQVGEVTRLVGVTAFCPYNLSF